MHDSDPFAPALPASQPSNQTDPFVIRMPLFHRNAQVRYQGRDYRVDHVVLRAMELKVSLQGLDDVVHADELAIEPSRLRLPVRRN